MPKQNLEKTVSIRIKVSTYDKLQALNEKVEMSLSELARECLILGIAKMEVEKP